MPEKAKVAASTRRGPENDQKSMHTLHQRTKMTKLPKSSTTCSKWGAPEATLFDCGAKRWRSPEHVPPSGRAIEPLRLPEDRTNTRGEVGGGQAEVRSATEPRISERKRQRSKNAQVKKKRDQTTARVRAPPCTARRRDLGPQWRVGSSQRERERLPGEKGSPAPLLG